MATISCCPNWGTPRKRRKHERKGEAMQNVTRRNLLGLLRLAPAVPLAGHLLATPALAAETDSSARALLQRRNFPNVKLQDQDGKNVRFYDDLIKDKIV